MSDRAGAAPERLDRSTFSLAFADYFTGDRLDTSTEHVYAAEWNSRHGRFYIDERHVPTVEQGPTYPSSSWCTSSSSLPMTGARESTTRNRQRFVVSADTSGSDGSTERP